MLPGIGSDMRQPLNSVSNTGMWKGNPGLERAMQKFAGKVGQAKDQLPTKTRITLKAPGGAVASVDATGKPALKVPALPPGLSRNQENRRPTQIKCMPHASLRPPPVKTALIMV